MPDDVSALQLLLAGDPALLAIVRLSLIVSLSVVGCARLIVLPFGAAVALRAIRSLLASARARATIRIAFRPVSLSKNATPVALPPGRLRLATMPSLTGSVEVMKTIGIVFVADRANAAAGENAAITAAQSSSAPCSWRAPSLCLRGLRLDLTFRQSDPETNIDGACDGKCALSAGRNRQHNTRSFPAR